MPLNLPLTQWSGRRVWVVGASSGIGLALAERLHAAGAQVTVSARRGDQLDAWVGTHPGSLALPLDVTDATRVAEQWQRLQRLGVPDLLVYAAGHYRAQRATEWHQEEHRRHWAINYLGALEVLSHAVPAMLARGSGHVSLMASVAGYRGLPQSLAYGPTKAALIHLAEVMYQDLHPKGVGVSVINPGFVDTPLTAQNRFRMPALISPDEAAGRILQGWRKGLFEIHFPRRFTQWLRLGRWLPYRLYFMILRWVAP